LPGGFSFASELYIYYPLDSKVKPLQFRNFERQAKFLLSTSPVYRDQGFKSKVQSPKSSVELERQNHEGQNNRTGANRLNGRRATHSEGADWPSQRASCLCPTCRLAICGLLIAFRE